MPFTALHRLLGEAPGPITDELVDAAIMAKLAETDDLDWKDRLPPTKALNETDFPKDVAAMANSGGGMIVYGVEESEKQAISRRAVGVLTEVHERTLRAAAFNAISPPVFGLDIYRIGQPGNEVVAVVVPPSVDGPHLIYRDKYFGAPIRNDADTEWMKERQIEQLYRARFDERSRSDAALSNLYVEATAGRDVQNRAWLIAVARPRVPFTPHSRPTRDDARAMMAEAERSTLTWVGRAGIHPIESVTHKSPRPGLRRWNFVDTTSSATKWRESWVAIHHDASVSLVTAIGGQRSSWGAELSGRQIDSAAIEGAVSDFMALVRSVSAHHRIGEHEVRVGIEHVGLPILIETVDGRGQRFNGSTIPLAVFTPVTMTVVGDAPPLDFYWQVYDLAEDCINEGGISAVRLISPPPRDGD